MQSFYPVDVLDLVSLEPLACIMKDYVWSNSEKEVFVSDDEELYYDITYIGRNLLISVGDDEEIGW